MSDPRPDHGCEPLSYGGHDKGAGLVKSLYYPQLHHWLTSFGNDCSRFLVGVFEHHVASAGGHAVTAAVLSAVVSFLGLPPLSSARAQAIVSSSGGSKRFDHPHTRADRAMSNGTRVALRELFAPFNGALAALLDRHCQTVRLPRGAGAQASSSSSSDGDGAHGFGGGVLELPPGAGSSSRAAGGWLSAL